jgi:hypothetical protein
VNPLRLLPRATAAAALLFAAGCGGGGSSELTVSAQNAEAVAAAGVGAVTMAEGMSEMLDGMSDIFNPAAQVMPCDSGNVMLSVQDMGTAGLSTGDYANLDFNACVIDLGEGALTFNGGLYLRADDITGDPLSFPFTREFYGGYDALTATIFGAVVVIDGGITASLSSVDGETFALDVTCNDFSAFAQSGNAAFSGSLSGYHAARAWNETTGAYSLDFEGRVYATGLGSAQFDTTVPFTGTGDDHPSAGTFIVTGAMGATVTVIALDNVNVQILVDADADGVNETTINTTWDALENS